jgi:hypothetical protein
MKRDLSPSILFIRARTFPLLTAAAEVITPSTDARGDQGD